MQYNMNRFFFANFFLFVSYLIVLILACSVTIIHKQTCLSILGVKCCYRDVPCMFLCIMILMTAKQHEAGVGRYLLDDLNFVITFYF